MRQRGRDCARTIKRRPTKILTDARRIFIKFIHRELFPSLFFQRVNATRIEIQTLEKEEERSKKNRSSSKRNERREKGTR